VGLERVCLEELVGLERVGLGRVGLEPGWLESEWLEPLCLGASRMCVGRAGWHYRTSNRWKPFYAQEIIQQSLGRRHLVSVKARVYVLLLLTTPIFCVLSKCYPCSRVPPGKYDS
jgi:hypothetical protein